MGEEWKLNIRNSKKKSSIFIPTLAATGGLDAAVVELLPLSVSNPPVERDGTPQPRRDPRRGLIPMPAYVPTRHQDSLGWKKQVVVPTHHHHPSTPASSAHPVHDGSPVRPSLGEFSRTGPIAGSLRDVFCPRRSGPGKVLKCQNHFFLLEIQSPVCC